MNILLIYCSAGKMYHHFLIPSDQLTNFNLDEINNWYIPENDPLETNWTDNHREVKKLHDLVKRGQFNKYENPSLINANKVVLIGTY